MNQDSNLDLAIIFMVFVCMFLFCVAYMPMIVRWLT